VVGAKLLGFQVQAVRHLWEASRLGVGETDRGMGWSNKPGRWIVTAGPAEILREGQRDRQLRTPLLSNEDTQLKGMHALHS
jgi:hypothetical protein